MASVHPTRSTSPARRPDPAASLSPPPWPQGAQHLARIEQSHQRCTAIGLSRIAAPEHAPLSRADLGLVLERHRRLFHHAAPVMELLREQIVDTHSMVVLCDATGTIIHSIGDPDFLARASQVALQPGVNWSEPVKGTNAIGTALMDEAPTLVHAHEHFMHANHFLTCSAVPIFDPRGDVLGVLDVTGDHRSYHPHTMALVNMSARMIEHHWLSDDLDHQLCLHLHPRPECLGTLMDGIVVATPEGRIVGANRSALALLQMGAAAVRAHSLASLLGTTVAALLAHFRRASAPPLPLVLPDGRVLHAQARFGWQTWRRAAGVDTPAAAPGGDALPAAAGTLAALDTGDQSMAALLTRLCAVAGPGPEAAIPVLIVGERGTGKTTLARALHADSLPADAPLIVLDAAAMDERAPSAAAGRVPGPAADQVAGQPAGQELDHEAVHDLRSALAQALDAAAGGTLLLQRVDALPAFLQRHLLQALRAADVAPRARPRPRLVCTAHTDLRAAVAEGRFRQDLLERLASLTVQLPPLRARSDLAVLAQRLLAPSGAGATPPPLAPETEALLRRGCWPGNLRQLQAALRTAAALAGPGAALRPEHFDAGALADAGAGPAAPSSSPCGKQAAPGPADATSLRALEIATIRQTVEALGGNIAAAAKRLGISRNTIYRKLRWRDPA